jgi:hypothetical protein
MDMQWAYDYGCFIWGNTDWKCSDTFRVQWNEITPEEIDNDGTVRRDGKIGRVIVNVEGILSVNFI